MHYSKQQERNVIKNDLQKYSVITGISELFEAWEWYENRQVGLGNRFRSEVNKKIEEIENHPPRYPNKKRELQRSANKIFPLFNHLQNQ